MFGFKKKKAIKADIMGGSVGGYVTEVSRLLMDIGEEEPAKMFQDDWESNKLESGTWEIVKMALENGAEAKQLVIAMINDTFQGSDIECYANEIYCWLIMDFAEKKMANDYFSNCAENGSAIEITRQFMDQGLEAREAAKAVTRTSRGIGGSF